MDKVILTTITTRLQATILPVKVILFGSYANGTETKDSDVDLLVVADTSLPPLQRSPVILRALDDLPYAFDVVVKTTEEYDRLRKIVNHIVFFADKYGTVIYER